MKKNKKMKFKKIFKTKCDSKQSQNYLGSNNMKSSSWDYLLEHTNSDSKNKSSGTNNDNNSYIIDSKSLSSLGILKISQTCNDNNYFDNDNDCNTTIKSNNTTEEQEIILISSSNDFKNYITSSNDYKNYISNHKKLGNCHDSSTDSTYSIKNNDTLTTVSSDKSNDNEVVSIFSI